MSALAVGAAIGLGGEPARSEPDARAGALQALLACRAEVDGPARLACFDAATAQLDAAERAGEIVVVDREQAAAAKRQAFGFDLSALSIFDRGGDAEPMDRIRGAVARADRGGDGKWIVELEDGAVWAQTDTEMLARAPKPGSTAEIRKASMGGYFMNLDGQRAVRARRVR